MEWLSLIIPLLAAIICFIMFKKQMTPLEYVGLLGIPTLIILTCYGLFKNNQCSDVLYRSENIVKARYYEYWETWVEQTCQKPYDCNCSTDSKGQQTCQTCYEPYDCSYCDHNSEKYIAYTEYGMEFEITKEKYYSLIKKWGVKERFIELNRDINFEGSCGKDGDAYEIEWNQNEIFKADIATWKVSYDNRTQSANSAFNYPKISDSEADSLHLYHYPKIYNTYDQWNIIGSENLNVLRPTKDSILALYNYFNGYYGKRNKIHLYVLIWKNQPIDIAFKQEAYWMGGNENEVVVCIGVNKKNEVEWCKPFSWCDEKLTTVNIRNAVLAQKKLNLMKLYPSLTKEVTTYYKHKDLDKDFDYVTIDLTEGEIMFIWIITLLVTIGLCIGFTRNGIDNEDESENIFRKGWRY